MTGTIVRQNMVYLIMIFSCALFITGCGTTKWSDTARTGTEQLLISNAIDNAVGKIDFSPIGDKRIFLKTTAIQDATDNKYLALALRQKIAASGGIICDQEYDADYIVEVRVGAIGTDRDDMLIGIPALTIPSIPGTAYSASTIPEIPFIKRTRQRGIAKIALFAYNKNTGRPIWASGNNQSESQARNLWFAGTGPLTRGTIYNETTFAGHSMPSWLEYQRDRPLESFADHVVVYRELKNEEKLNSSKEVKNAGEKNDLAVQSTAVPVLPPPTFPAPKLELPSNNFPNSQPPAPQTIPHYFDIPLAPPVSTSTTSTPYFANPVYHYENNNLQEAPLK